VGVVEEEQTKKRATKMAGKGDTYRPFNYEEFEKHYNEIFGLKHLCDKCVESCYVEGKKITNCRDYYPIDAKRNLKTPQSNKKGSILKE